MNFEINILLKQISFSYIAKGIVGFFTPKMKQNKTKK